MNQNLSLSLSPRSAANTPSCAVTELKTKIVVLAAENGILSSSVSTFQISGFTARKVKYIANNAAKNINSLDNQTMVPMAVILGRLIRWFVKDAVDIVPILSPKRWGIYGWARNI